MPSELIFSLIWAGFALVFGLLLTKVMEKIHFPNVTGFLIAGILIGPWVIGLFAKDKFQTIVDSLNWISEVALGFIAFTVGGSFNISSLKKVGKKAVIISIFEALGGAILVMVSLFIPYFAGMKNHGLTIPIILILSSIACATAPAATLLVINQYKAKGPVTETLIPVVAFDDAVALIAFSILFSISMVLQTGSSFNVVDAIIIPLLEILLSIVLGAVIGFIVSGATKLFKSRHNRLIAIIAGVLIAVGLSQISTTTIFNWSFDFQFSSLLTSMMVGAIYYNFAEGKSRTAEFLDKFTAPVFMLFFIISGSKLNFGIFGSDKASLVIGIALIYLVFRVVGKWIGSLSSCKITHCDSIVQKYLGFTLIPQAGVALGLANKAQIFMTSSGYAELGMLIYTCIIISTMIYELTGPLVTKWALQKAGEIDSEVSQRRKKKHVKMA